jgi:acetylornithine aminotransferase/acetylornithine/N-succinyldiaminopimelate aminotransferase
LIKVARLHGVKKAGGEEGRCFKIICAKQAFHGRTFGGMSATPQEKIQKGFRPLVPGFAFGELNDLGSFADLIDDQTCAIFVETIQGESGIRPCTDEFLIGLRHLCDRHNLLLLIDEVQCGFGRTGRFFAFEQAGIMPDAIGMAKALGGGIPMGAVWIRENAAEYFQPGSHGTTFGGTPLACAAALAVLHVIEKEKLLENVTASSGPWLQELEKLVAEFPQQLLGVRGRGYMIGLQFAGETAPYHAALREGGLLAVTAGGNVIRLLPPLIAGPAELNRSVEILRGVLQAKA